jgi:hypothetical protein
VSRGSQAEEMYKLIVAAVNEKAELAGLESACELLVTQYNTMPDGPLGHGLTNEPFLKIRAILEDRAQGGKEDAGE